jgi:hypothetical protein
MVFDESTGSITHGAAAAAATTTINSQPIKGSSGIVKKITFSVFFSRLRKKNSSETETKKKRI